jgi:hypothetical protein
MLKGADQMLLGFAPIVQANGDRPIPKAMKLQRLSQAHLKVLSDCPRKFEYIYLASLFSPPEPDSHRAMQWGSDFHRLLHQRELGISIEPFLAHEPQMQAALEGLQQAAPELFAQDGSVARESEQVRTLAIPAPGGCANGQYLFTTIYDLVILGDQGRIIDWKTYGKPRQTEKLAQDWQTRLYLYVLAETSDYDPASLAFTYWFVQSNPPQSATFTYSSAQHRQTTADLEILLDKLTVWLQAYQQGASFPQLEPSAKACETCHFAARCHRLPQLAPEVSLAQLQISAIAELSI